MPRDFHHGARARHILLIAAALSLALLFVPYGGLVGYPLLLLSTLAHEMGHGVAALLVGGSFASFALYADGSGIAQISGATGPVGRALVAAGGLLGPALGAGALFVAATRPRRSRAALGLLGVLLLLACALVVRNLFGWLFVATVGVTCLVVATRLSALASQLGVALLAVQLSASVFARADYLFTDVAQTASGARPSDAALIADALFLPYWFWGAACGVASLGVLGLGVRRFWRATHRSMSASA